MRRAGDILKAFLDSRTAEQADLYHTFFTGWHEVVGERIAAHSSVKDIQAGIVVVEVDHPGWIQMIQLKQSQFVRALQKRYPNLQIHGLKMQLPWNERSPGAGDRVEARQGGERATPPRAAAQHEETEVTPPADPRIRGALARLGKAIEDRSRSGD